MSQHLSKSRYTSGLQCSKLLWWKVYEPDAPELVADDASQALFTRGQRIGELARAYVPGGVLIDLPYYEFDLRVTATAKALADGAPVVYEACFLEDGVFVAVDILERRDDGFGAPGSRSIARRSCTSTGTAPTRTSRTSSCAKT